MMTIKPIKKRLMEKLEEVEELLLDVLYQACGEEDRYEEDALIDNRCISAFERACDYLEKKGFLTKKNDRIFAIKIGENENGRKG